MFNKPNLPMQKSSTLKNFQDQIPNKKREVANARPSKSTVDFILAYAAALMVFKTKTGVYNVLQN